MFDMWVSMYYFSQAIYYSFVHDELIHVATFLIDYYSTFVSAGLPSYVIQEEFDRYTGYWWQISDINDSYFQILYELVDQRDVDSVKLSNCLFDEQQSDFAFPKPGSSNGVVTLNILNIPKNILCKESDGEELRNFSLENRLKEHIPWMEYIVRCGWIPGRNEVCTISNTRS